MKRILLSILLVMVLLVGGCGFEGDPMIDDAYTRNVYPGETDTYQVGSEDLRYSEGYFEDLDVSDDLDVAGTTTFNDSIVLGGGGKVWLEFRPDIDFETVRANGQPTWVHRSVFGGFSMPIWDAGGNVNEELSVDMCVPDRWDGESDFYVHIHCWVDTAQDAADDTFKLWIQYDNFTPGVDVVWDAATATSKETTTGVCDIYQSFIVTHQIAYNMGRHPVVEPGDNLSIKIRRMAVVMGNEIEGEVVIAHIGVIFQCDKLGNPTWE